MADFSQLDKASIQAFIDQDLSAFIDDIKSVLTDEPSMLDMSSGVTTPENFGEVSAGMPISMGKIADDDYVSGESFASALATNIETVVSTLEGQQKTFEEIEEGLQQTIEELFKAQGDNLTSIEADDFTEVLSDSGFSGETPVPEPDDSSSDEDSDSDSDGGDDS
ncbi:type VII secretion system-associated protein [Streptomyces sp. NPDC049916]|uniref:type VII secretion system-associated protein n=1 Tax=Streptomyces sp. NPDC049916 TaxID=3155156 RepID=UPI00341A71CB